MLVLYSNTTTPRLQYIVDFISNEIFHQPIRIINDTGAFKIIDQPKLNYSGAEIIDSEFFIKNHSLLFEDDIKDQQVECFNLNFHKAFFVTEGDFPFDIFAAAFYLLSRYEEYLPHEKDNYGRYSHTQSLAFREGFLHMPLVNIWIEEFKKSLQKKFPGLLFKRKNFKCLLTYDIDSAYAFKHKGFLRTSGGMMKSLFKGNFAEFKKRLSVVNGNEKDPYDCFEWLDALHLYCRLKPYYFFLVAKKQKGYDKNTSTGVRVFQNLIEYYAANYKVGIHPSWQSGDEHSLLKEEIEWLEAVADKNIIHSRQHYLRFDLPLTFRRLIDAGIQKEFSMGYGTTNGFRASVCSSFNWYDLERDQSTSLLIYPFCFMDANSFFEQKHKPEQAYRELIQLYDQVKKMNGVLITIWHNAVLGTDPIYKGWRDLFELFMKETVYWDAYYDEG